jgi:hypothetical protein
MAAPTTSPMLSARAGNRTQRAVARNTDPVYLALSRWNTELVLAGDRPAGTEDPLHDGRAYTVVGEAQPFCRPALRVAWRAGFQPGPEVRFEQRDDDLHLTVVFEEDPSKRVAGALPFDVRVKSAKLVYGAGSDDVLVFAEPLAEPLDPATGPAFRIEADARVPLDERRARLVAALQARGAASWVVTLEFEWARILPPPPDPDPGPRPRPVPPHRPGVPVGTRPRPVVPSRTMVARRPAGAVAASAVALQPAAAVERQAVLHEILATPPPRPRPQPTVQEKTIAIERRLGAEYPKDSQENRPIFAAVSGDYAQIGWKNTAHGWFQPTPIRDTVYCLPDAYRLQVDAVTGLPSIHAVLLRKSEGGELVDDLDPKHYTVRLTLRARPDFDAERLNSLRALIRAESSNQIQYADLVLGGYSGARFVPDPALAGLGELFAGSTAGTREAIDPAEGFTLTYQGNAEFIDLLFQRLKGEGIEGTVELDLQEPGGTTRKQPVPVVLTLRRLAPVALPWTFAVSPAPPPAAAPDPAALLPRAITLENPTGVEVKVGALQAHALQKSPVTGRVDDWYRATPNGTWPLT